MCADVLSGQTKHQPRVYIAPLPHVYNVELLFKEGRSPKGCHSHTFAESLLANPTGSLVNSSSPDGIRHTPYFGLGFYHHVHLLSAPFRTMSLEEADLVYVPFYVTLLSYAHKPSACFPVYSVEEQESIVAAFWASIDTLLPALGSKPHWLALAQLEHDIAMGCGGTWGLSFLCNPRSSEFVFTVPEAFGTSLKDFHLFNDTETLHNNMVIVPYLGHFHHSPDQPTVNQLLTMKTYTVTMSFTWRSSSVRPKLLADCSARESLCTAPMPHWHDGSHMQTNVAEVMGAYSKSWYCAQPDGDTPLRIAIYDCMAIGHVLPVFFDQYIAAHLPFADILEYENFITIITDPRDKGNVVDLLSESTSIAERLEMIEALQRVAHVFQYAVNPTYSVITFAGMHTIDKSDDAFTAGFKALLRHLCARRLLPNQRCNK